MMISGRTGATSKVFTVAVEGRAELIFERDA